MFWNLIKIIRGHMLNVNFGQNFQSSRTIQKWHAKFKEEGCCAPGKVEELPHHLQLKRSKEFKTSSSGAPGSQSEELVVNFRCLQQPFGE